MDPMTTSFTPISATLGGILIGLAAIWLMLARGRIAGISGIVGGIADHWGDRSWRVAFLLGLIAAPFVYAAIKGGLPSMAALNITVETSTPMLIAAGVLVGVGTQLGRGCTSGHGVCGLARLSRRSLVATLTFMTTGAATVFTVRHVL